MINKRDKYYVTDYLCKHCGNSNMSPHCTNDGFIKGWTCNYCGKTIYPVRDELPGFVNVIDLTTSIESSYCVQG